MRVRNRWEIVMTVKMAFVVTALCLTSFADPDPYWYGTYSGGAKIYLSPVSQMENIKVGIGTSNPDAKVQIGDLSSDGIYLLNVYSNSFPTIRAKSNGSAGGLLKLGYSGGDWTFMSGGSGVVISDPNDEAQLTFNNNCIGIGEDVGLPGSKLQVNGNAAIGYSGLQYGPQNGLIVKGKVGIGSGATNPSEELEVDGDIKCNSVIIGEWVLEAPDYVFEKEYKLPSLKDVEKHITAKKHLPDVPSAADMKKKGVNLSELNMTLLKKIEELTLYAIGQNKIIEEQNRRITALESKISGRK